MVNWDDIIEWKIILLVLFSFAAKKTPQLALLFVQLHYSEVTFQEQVCDVQNVIFFCALILVTYDILLTLYL